MTWPAPPSPSFWSIATDPSVMRRAAKIAMVVGIVIALINYGDLILSGAMGGKEWIKVVVTFLVPYCVSTYSSVMAVRDRLQTLEEPCK